jgi:hypothetical protein
MVKLSLSASLRRMEWTQVQLYYFLTSALQCLISIYATNLLLNVWTLNIIFREVNQ